MEVLNSRSVKLEQQLALLTDALADRDRQLKKQTALFRDALAVKDKQIDELQMKLREHLVKMLRKQERQASLLSEALADRDQQLRDRATAFTNNLEFKERQISGLREKLDEYRNEDKLTMCIEQVVSEACTSETSPVPKPRKRGGPRPPRRPPVDDFGNPILPAPGEAGKVIHCERCWYTTTNKHRMTRHMAGAHALRNCAKCSFTCRSRGEMVNHRKTHDPNPKHRFACEVCGFTAGSRNDVKKHMFQHTGVYIYQCDKCPMGFNRKQRLTAHMLNEHSSP